MHVSVQARPEPPKLFGGDGDGGLPAVRGGGGDGGGGLVPTIGQYVSHHEGRGLVQYCGHQLAGCA